LQHSTLLGSTIEVHVDTCNFKYSQKTIIYPFYFSQYYDFPSKLSMKASLSDNVGNSLLSRNLVKIPRDGEPGVPNFSSSIHQTHPVKV
jgi:hypothetical protein